MQAVPDLKKLAQDYASKGLVLVAPSLDAEAAVRKFKETHKIEYALLSDSRDTAKAFGVRAYPTMFLLGKDGKVRWKGHWKDEAFTKALEAALAEK